MPKLFSKKFLGIDIGTSAIRIAEVEGGGRSASLINFGQIDTALVERGFNPDASADFSADEIAEMIQAVLAEMKTKTRQCAFSIPDFATFFTSFSLPAMTKKEMAEAVMFEAPQHIPLPIKNVTIDWRIIGESPKKDASEKIEVMVVAIPNDIINQYREIASKAKLQVVLMEAEVFGLARAVSLEKEGNAVCLVDIGMQSTACSLLEKQILRYSHSFDRGQSYLMEQFAKKVSLGREMAETFTRNYGFRIFSALEPEVKAKAESVLREALMPVMQEVRMAIEEYRRVAGTEISKILISGGAASSEEIKKQFADYLGKEVQSADPFREIGFSGNVSQDIARIGPVYAVAIGTACRGLDFSNKEKSSSM